MKKLLIATILTAIVGFTNFASAADPTIDPVGHGYIHIDGGYAFGNEGSGAEDGLDPGEVRPGDGIWASAYAGYITDSSFDFRLSVGIADLGRGKLNDNGPVNIYGVDDAKMFNLDGEVGYIYDLGGPTVRPFVGIRYLDWKQDQGYHPDAPLNCCFMDSEYSGFGPKIGFDASVPLSESFNLVGGADVSILFGNIDFSGGSQFIPLSGSDNRTVVALGAFAGFDYSFTQNVFFGARYRVLALDGTSFDNAGILTGGPFGKADNLLHGPSASLTFGF